MSQALSKRARSRSAWRGSTVARWGRWKIVKWGYLPPMPRGRAMPWWIHGSSCRSCGLRRTMQTDVPSAKCQVPDDIIFHTKPQLAVEMLRAIRSEGRLPFKYVVADCLYG